jgi:hypothetical protein
MSSKLRVELSTPARGSIALFVLTLIFSVAANSQDDGRFEARSVTFSNGTTLPVSAIANILVGGSNICSLDGSAGGNQSPQLSWTNVPAGTRSFAVVLFDTTASFAHWGIYNIAGDRTGLPANAGAAESAYGTQVFNDFPDQNYDGPCPPSNFPPNVHHYVFTVYALRSGLELPSSANFPANADTLFRALLKAAERGNVLASASITGLYSTTPTN